MGDVIYTNRFNQKSQECPLQNRLLREVHESLLTLAIQAKYGSACQARLAVEMGKNPQGMSKEDTLSSISIVSNNAISMENMAKFIDQIRMTLCFLDTSNDSPHPTPAA